MDVKLESINNVKSDTYATNGLPSMALDSGSPCRNDAIFAIMRIAGPVLFGFTRLEKLHNASLESFGGSDKLLSSGMHSFGHPKNTHSVGFEPCGRFANPKTSGMHCFGQPKNTHSAGFEPCGRSVKPQTSRMHSFGQPKNTHSVDFELLGLSVSLRSAD